ncbi:hypothetical protein J2Y43_002133 [Dyadobacter sp. BE31]|nr:hypothetical protein [Dyadobacter sp. BE31]
MDGKVTDWISISFRTKEAPAIGDGCMRMGNIISNALLTSLISHNRRRFRDGIVMAFFGGIEIESRVFQEIKVGLVKEHAGE